MRIVKQWTYEKSDSAKKSTCSSLRRNRADVLGLPLKQWLFGKNLVMHIVFACIVGFFLVPFFGLIYLANFSMMWTYVTMV